MTEELYIYIDNERHKVDLQSPSGIVLSYESMILNASGDFGGNRSYTFRLPATQNNQRVLELVQDCRRESVIFATKFHCDYIIDGVVVIDNGYIRINAFDGGYAAVMTWEVLDALQIIKDDNININELDKEEDVETGSVVPPMKYSECYQIQFDNLQPVLKAFYGAGVPSESIRTGNRRVEMEYQPWYYALPVVPVPYIINRIEEHYGIRLDIYNHCTFVEQGDKENIIDYGAIPLVSTKIRVNHENDNMCELKKPIPSANLYTDGSGHEHYELPYYGTEAKPDGIEDPHVFWFSRMNKQNGTNFTNHPIDTLGHDTQHDKYRAKIGLSTSNLFHKFRLTGIITARFRYKDLDHTENEPETTTNVIAPKLTIWRNVRKRLINGLELYQYEQPESLGSVDGVKIGEGRSVGTEDGYWWIYEFNFDPEISGQEITVDGREVGSNFIFASFNKLAQFEMDYDMTIEDVMHATYYYEEGDYPHPSDIISNLPEVSCLDFIKSLFHMTGSYPLSVDGEIKMRNVQDIFDNISNAADWTRYVLTEERADTDDISFSIGDYARRNWYLTKSDEIEKILNTEEKSRFDAPEDEYADGYAIVEDENNVDDDDKTIVQVPWNAPYIKNGDNVRMGTGNTFKYWSLPYGEKELQAKEAKPCYGLLYFDEGSVRRDYRGTYTQKQARKEVATLFGVEIVDDLIYFRSGQQLRDAGWTDADASKQYYLFNRIQMLYNTTGRKGQVVARYFIYTPINWRGKLATEVEMRGLFSSYNFRAEQYNQFIEDVDRYYGDAGRYLITSYATEQEAIYYNTLLTQFLAIVHGDAPAGQITVEPIDVKPTTERSRQIPEHLGMKAWAGFNNTGFCLSMQEMLKHPFVVSVKIKLPLIELVKLDMSVPIYLEQYNSYFAIIKIQRETDGICTAELARIPVELLK